MEIINTMHKIVKIYILGKAKELHTDTMLSSLDHVVSPVHRLWNYELHSMFQLPWKFSMYVTHNLTDVRCNVRQLQHGGWGKGAGKQSICSIYSSNPNPVVWICHYSKEFPGLQGAKQQQKSTKLKPFFPEGGWSFLKSAPAYYVGKEGIRPKLDQQIIGKKILENKWGLVQRWPLSPSKPWPTLNSSTRGESSAQNAVCILKPVHGFSLPEHNKTRMQISRDLRCRSIRTLQASPGTQLWSVLHIIPSKLRWLRISKHSIDLKIVFCYIHSIIYY